ncbi:MAG: transcriptional regulator, LysR family [Sporomusa sp.]|jgi:DNA-binding transcriptional LysR family regulator|nr:transcriptional regulator, LysR family [Sporomusa sp.]
MEYNQYTYFQIVAQLQNISQAAKVLSISQPALSRAISKLEQEVGTPLFERQGKSIVLNRYGKIYYQYINQAVQNIEQGKQAIQQIIDPEQGNIAIGLLPSLGENLIPALISNFRSTFPKIQFKMIQNCSITLNKQLLQGEIDLAFSSNVVETRDQKWIPLYSEELYVIVPKGHWANGLASIAIKELCTESFIAFKQGYVMRVISDQIFEKLKIIPQISYEADEITATAGLVEANLGYAIIPKIKTIESLRISYVRISEPVCRRAIGILTTKGRFQSKAVQQFITFVIEFCKEYDPSGASKQEIRES